MFCKSCGAKLEDGVKFCPSCGQGIDEKNETNLSNTTEEKRDNFQKDEEFINAYISGFPNNNLNDEHLPYYKKNFKKFDLNGVTRFKFTWNWSTFLVGGWHLIYRKAYVLGIISMILFSVLPGGAGWIFTFVLAVCSNFIFYKRYENNMEKFKTAYPNEKNKQLELIAEEGGTNKVAKTLAIVYYVIYFIFWFLVGFILGME